MIEFQERARHWLQKTSPDVLAIIGGHAPSFVYGGAVRGLPVFMYHTVDQSFERDLMHLRDGGYRTVGAEQLERAMRGPWTTGGRDVALTFDDGHRSVTSVAAPLLAAYECKAITFVVSALVPPTSSEMLAGWDALSQWVSRGVLEVGAHSMYHQYVPVSPETIGIMSPSIQASFLPRIITRYAPDMRTAPIGTPLLLGRPRYVVRRAFCPDRDALVRRTSDPNYTGTLAAETARLRWQQEPEPIPGSYESEAESERAIVEDMATSMALVARHCPNPAARHLCYPWNAGDERTDRLALRAGAAMVYKGVLGTSEPGHGPYPPCVQRLPADFLRALPGGERRSLAGIVWERLITRREASIAKSIDSA